MKAIIEALPDALLEDLATANTVPPTSQITAAEGEALRAPRVIIFEHDRTRRFGGLRRIQDPSGDFLWVCPHHRVEYDPGLPTLPETQQSTVS